MISCIYLICIWYSVYVTVLSVHDDIIHVVPKDKREVSWSIMLNSFKTKETLYFSWFWDLYFVLFAQPGLLPVTLLISVATLLIDAFRWRVEDLWAGTWRHSCAGDDTQTVSQQSNRKASIGTSTLHRFPPLFILFALDNVSCLLLNVLKEQ